MDTINQQHDDGDEHFADLASDLLFGKEAIYDFLVSIGWPESVDVYYLKRTGRWPIGNTGGDRSQLIASKRRLARYTQKSAPTTPQKIDAA